METDEKGEPCDSDEEEDLQYFGGDDGVESVAVPEEDDTNNLGVTDPEPPTLQEGTGISQHEPISMVVQGPPGSEDEPIPEVNDHASGDVNEGRAARRKRLAARERVSVKEVVVRELEKERAKEEHKYHSKKGVGGAGRMKGSKAKQDTRVKKTDWAI
jgi:RIO kinase 2